jgi:nucleotide-binding universal stress UspA family protein
VNWQPIIAGVDGSAESLRAASLAWQIARAADVRCVMVYAVPEVWAPGALEALVSSPDIVERLVSDVQRLVTSELGAEVPASVLHSLVARPGRPGVVLDAVARELGAGLIVVGARHHGALARGLGGSTAHHLVRTAPAPVLVVGTSSRVPRRVLVATDLGNAAGPTLATASRFAGLFGAQQRVVHVLEPAKFPTVVPLSLDQDVFEERSRAEFERLMDLQQPDIPPGERILRRGRADEEIAEAVAQWSADLLVVGSHGKGWIDRLLIGSTTERLLNRLPTSLLVVPISQPAARPAVQSAAQRRRKGTVII